MFNLRLHLHPDFVYMSNEGICWGSYEPSLLNNGIGTVNLEIFMRVLFLRNFAGPTQSHQSYIFLCWLICLKNVYADFLKINDFKILFDE